jgi:hypothetical protein
MSQQETLQITETPLQQQILPMLYKCFSYSQSFDLVDLAHR